MIKKCLHIILFVLCGSTAVKLYSAKYVVNTLSNLRSRFSSALPGDTIEIVNGTYNWGLISIANTKGSASSNWIVVKPQTPFGVTFTGATSLSFSGNRILITGFKFQQGNAGTSDVIQFRTSSTSLANYSRLTQIIIDNYNSDSTGGVNGVGADIDNKWVSIYGIKNRVDHCTFINKFNAGATVVVWYDNTNYPQKSTSTYHVIDSNYFKGRGYLGANGGESIRVGVSQTSRSNGYNTIAYNLFENCMQTEPEIISNKSNFNTYQYNTFLNCSGGLTLRHGRYCTVNGNIFIVNKSSVKNSYGIRAIDKGHIIVNNYIEGVNGNSNSFNSLRCPLILYNGLSSTNDTTIASKANGYFPADSCVVAFNTVVNAIGGAGLVLGFTDAGNNTFQPKGIVCANNIIKMQTGQAAYLDTSNKQLTYYAEGNFVDAPRGTGLKNNTGFISKSMTFISSNKILLPPNIVIDAALNSSQYTHILQSKDLFQTTRSVVYDVGCVELNSTGTVITKVLDSNQVGAGTPISTSLSSNHILLSSFYRNNEFFAKLFMASGFGDDINRMYLQASVDGVSFIDVQPINFNPNQIEINIPLAQYSNYKYFRIQYFQASANKKMYSNVIQSTKEIDDAFIVYPNPAKELLNIYTSTTGKYRYQLCNYLGKQIKAGYASGAHSLINLGNVQSGIYFLNLEFDNIHSKTFKIYIEN